jgi:hypothetical protein
VDEVRELQEELSRLRSLQEHPGFEYLMRIAGAQLETRKQQILLTPLPTMDSVLGQEYAKGEVSGIELFTRIVDIRMRDLAEEIQERLRDNEHDAE